MGEVSVRVPRYLCWVGLVRDGQVIDAYETRVRLIKARTAADALTQAEIALRYPHPSVPPHESGKLQIVSIEPEDHDFLSRTQGALYW